MNEWRMRSVHDHVEVSRRLGRSRDLIRLAMAALLLVTVTGCGRRDVGASNSGGQSASSATGSSKFAKLSTPEVARLRGQLLVEKKAAYGESSRFTVRGKIVQRGDERASIFGKALPAEGDPSKPGIHISDACLFVDNPKAHGQFMGEWYISTDIYYVGESSGQNAFGAEVPCSVYGDLPSRVKKAVTKVEEKIEAVEQELRFRTTAEREAAGKISVRLEEIQSRSAAIEKERNELLSAHRNEPPASWMGANQKLIDERNFLNREKQELDIRYLALKKRVDAVWEGVEVPSVDVMFAQMKAEADARQREKDAKEIGGLRGQIATEQKVIQDIRVQLEADTRIHDQNILDKVRNGSSTKGEMSWFTEHKAALESQIKSREEKIAELDTKVRAITGEPAPPSSAPPAAEAVVAEAQPEETVAQQEPPPPARPPATPERSSAVPVRASAPKPPKNTGELTRIQSDIDRETSSLEGVKRQLAAETQIHEQTLRDMQKSGSNPASTIKYFNEMKAAREKRIKELEDKIAALEARRSELAGNE